MLPPAGHLSDCHKGTLTNLQWFLSDEIVLLGVSISPTQFPTLPTCTWGEQVTPFLTTIVRQKLIKRGHLWWNILTSLTVILWTRFCFDWRIDPLIVLISQVLYLTSITIHDDLFERCRIPSVNSPQCRHITTINQLLNSRFGVVVFNKFPTIVLDVTIIVAIDRHNLVRTESKTDARASTHGGLFELKSV